MFSAPLPRSASPENTAEALASAAYTSSRSRYGKSASRSSIDWAGRELSEGGADGPRGRLLGSDATPD